MSMSESNQKFVIVGAGLVGCLAAVYLSKLGFEVVVYEYRDDIRKNLKVHGKSINLALSHRGLNALQKAGIEWNSIHGMLVPMKGRMIHETDGKCQVLLYDVKYNQNIYSIGRNDLNKMLLNEAEKKVQFNFGCKVTKVDFTNRILKVLRIRDNAEIEENFDYLIGCDGAYSTVRYHMLKTPLFNCSQTYIDHGYMELSIPAEGSQKNAMTSNHLHIWPRVTFMMIALPNENGSWTVTLFMPFQQFEAIKNDQDLLKFFRRHFEDALPLIGERNLIDTYFSSKPQPLIAVKCDRYTAGSRCLIIGDAAHAVVPFYGQGMNAGFEDCYILYEIFKSEGLSNTFEEFSKRRTIDTHAISNLSMYNYLEMRNLVTSKTFLMKKALENALYKCFGNHWTPLYVCVTFSSTPYSRCLDVQRFQNKILKILFGAVIVSLCFLALGVGYASI